MYTYILDEFGVHYVYQHEKMMTKEQVLDLCKSVVDKAETEPKSYRDLMIAAGFVYLDNVINVDCFNLYDACFKK